MSVVECAIESFRDAALSPARWPQALDELGQLLNSDGVSLVLKSTTLDSIAVSSSIKPFIPLYMAGPIRDPREQRVKPSLREGFMPDCAYFSRQEIDRDPYYQEFMRPRGFGWNAVAALDGDLMLSFKRSFNRGPYEGADLQALDSALPALRAVSRVANLAWRSHFAGQLSAFERLHRGAILVDARGRVLLFNSCVTFGDGFDVKDGYLQVSGDGDQDAFRRFLVALLRPSHHAAVTTPSVLKLPRPSRARSWMLDGVACNDAMRSLHSDAAALILVSDFQHHAAPRYEVLEQFFRLTRTECALAGQLAAGASVQEAAAALSISEGHARQRLKSIFNKTRTSRQGELIALLAKFG